MNRLHPPAALAALLATTAAAQGPALTIYNQDFAVVRDHVALDLAQGTNAVSFVGVTTHLEPDSVVLRDPTGKVQLAVLEQNYRSDTISQGLLLHHFEGKEIDFLVADRDGVERTVRGKVIRSGYTPNQAASSRYGNQFAMRQRELGNDDGAGSPVIEVDGRLRFSLPGQPLFPALGDDAILMPTLDWRIFATEAAKLTAEVSYITGGMSWQASYNLISPEQGDTLDIVGWITIDNQSGKGFPEAVIKLMAGDVNKLQPEGGPRSGSDDMFVAAPTGGAPKVTEKAFDEFHLYSLPLPTTLRDRQQKQVEFVRAMHVASKTLYVYDGAAFGNYRGWNADAIRNNPDYGTQSNPKVWVMREFANTKANGLGMPLPKGRTRFYRRDDADGRLEFTGENLIDHTPKDETLRIHTGLAFDIVGERRRTDFRYENGNKQMEESFEIRVKNHKDAAVEVRVAEHLYRWVNWTVIQKSSEFVKVDAQSIEFRVQVPANGEQVVTYRVRYDWQ
ncbi:MAG TPA: hypothetical protein VFZ65_23595 [Planctomycetota bacterium]|nr:hypothetical protein [Planctomycetota bacterium]